MPFRSNSSDFPKKYPRNISHMPVVFFWKIFDFEQNAYSRTSSQVRSFQIKFLTPPLPSFFTIRVGQVESAVTLSTIEPKNIRSRAVRLYEPRIVN